MQLTMAPRGDPAFVKMGPLSLILWIATQEIAGGAGGQGRVPLQRRAGSGCNAECAQTTGRLFVVVNFAINRSNANPAASHPHMPASPLPWLIDRRGYRGIFSPFAIHGPPALVACSRSDGFARLAMPLQVGRPLIWTNPLLLAMPFASSSIQYTLTF